MHILINQCIQCSESETTKTNQIQEHKATLMKKIHQYTNHETIVRYSSKIILKMTILSSCTRTL